MAKRPRLTRQQLAALLTEHNARTGGRLNAARLAVTTLTLWDGTELCHCGGYWFRRTTGGCK